jgi:Ca-activated chloride channel homolog
MVTLLAAASATGWGETGVIIPSDRQAPDPDELSIESFKIAVKIDNGHVLVHLDEVFHNKTNRVLEGTYQLALPANASISDFAVWDDVTRIPGVILERKRAGELYSQIRNETIDPGLLESGEVAESTAPGQATHSTQFAVRIVPIPAYGYKRVEAEYRQTVPLSELGSQFSLPLKASDENPQHAQHFEITLDLSSPQKLSGFNSQPASFPLDVNLRQSNLIKASYRATNVALDRDLDIHFGLENDRKPVVQAYRDQAAEQAGFFETSAIVQPVRKPSAKSGQRSVIVLFDASLSMQWDKLERSFQSLESILRSLGPGDVFNVVVFNSTATASYPTPQPALPPQIAHTLDFVRSSRLTGGTNLQRAFETAFSDLQQNTYFVLISDGGATEGTINSAQLNSWFDKKWQAVTDAARPKVYVLAIGDDADLKLLQQFSKHAGVFEAVGSTEPLDFKLKSFVSKLGLTPFDSIGMDISASVEPKFVYPVETDTFPGSRVSWVGQYGSPGKAEVRISAALHGKTEKQTQRVALPGNDQTHTYLPVSWARARVDALLEKIDREGEDKASIDEIIELSRRYRFVTPYTSFLAAPRALLRPRLIRPGDPLLRVRTDASVTSVVALFPFGLIQPLRYLKAEDIWQTRFLAPADLADGTYPVRLILRDRDGHIAREQKTFIISSKAPVVQVRLESKAVHPGSSVALRVQASATTRTIAVKLFGADPLFLHWNDAQKSNTGVLQVPAELAAGRYSLHVTAEDIAHNVSHLEVPLDVLP